MAIVELITLAPLLCVGFGGTASDEGSCPGITGISAEQNGGDASMPQRVGKPLLGAEALRILDEWKMERNAGKRFVFKVTRIIYSGNGNQESVRMGQFRLYGPSRCSLELEEVPSDARGEDAQSKCVIWAFDQDTLRVDWPNAGTHLEYSQRAEDQWFMDFIPVKWLLGVDSDAIQKNWDIIVVRATASGGVNPHTALVTHPYMAYYIKALPRRDRPDQYVRSITVSLDTGTFLPRTVVIDTGIEGPIFYQFELIEACRTVSPCSPVDRTTRKCCRNRDLVSRLKHGVDRRRIAHH